MKALPGLAWLAVVALAGVNCLLPEFSYVVEHESDGGGTDASSADVHTPGFDAGIDRRGPPADEDVVILDAPLEARAPLGQPGTWELIFDDEFDGNSLDPTKWVPCFPWGSAAGCALVPNPDVWYAPENVSVEGGSLRLRAERRATTVQGKTYTYASGMVSTSSFGGPYRRLFRYGYVEARVRAPAGAGLMSTLWALPPDAQYPPDLGILSVRGDQTSVASLGYTYNDATGRLVEATQTYGAADFGANFHTVAVSWTPDFLRWYIDGVEARPAFDDAQFITKDELYLLANLQVGARATGAPTAATAFPCTLEIDYVRVWRRASVSDD
jgi:beta-glucanase (GH16 family)